MMKPGTLASSLCACLVLSASTYTVAVSAAGHGPTPQNAVTLAPVPATSYVTTLLVGPTRGLKTPTSALAIATPFTSIDIDPGQYDDSSFVATDDVRLRGVGGRPAIIPATAPIAGPDRGALVVEGKNVTLENIEIARSYGDGSQAAIRLESSGLVTLRNVSIHHSDDGILGGESGGQLVVEDSEIYDNGTGDGQNHNVYLSSRLDKASFIRVKSHGAYIGHLLKSRAKITEVIGGVYDDTHDASFEFDFPEGGDVLLDGVLARKGPNADNDYFAAYGEEVGRNIPGPPRSIPHRLVIRNSAFWNDQRFSESEPLAGRGLLLTIGPYFTPAMVHMENVDLYWPDDRMAALQEELDGLAAAGASVVNVRVKSISSTTWPPPLPTDPDPGPPAFVDVPAGYWAERWISALRRARVTDGCSVAPPAYCPDAPVSRAEMAAFLLKAKYEVGFAPPPAVGRFLDVAPGHWAAAWIEELAAEGITGGCAAARYCPDAAVSRAEMAVFLSKAKYGAGSHPPAASGRFIDVPPAHWAAAWIEQLAAEGITGGCGGSRYCPDAPVTRAEMAVFLVKQFALPLD